MGEGHTRARGTARHDGDERNAVRETGVRGCTSSFPSHPRAGVAADNGSQTGERGLGADIPKITHQAGSAGLVCLVVCQWGEHE